MNDSVNWYDSSPDNMAYFYAELTVSSLTVAVAIASQHSFGLPTVGWPD